MPPSPTNLRLMLNLLQVSYEINWGRSISRTQSFSPCLFFTCAVSKFDSAISEIDVILLLNKAPHGIPGLQSDWILRGWLAWFNLCAQDCPEALRAASDGGGVCESQSDWSRRETVLVPQQMDACLKCEKEKSVCARVMVFVCAQSSPVLLPFFPPRCCMDLHLIDKVYQLKKPLSLWAAPKKFHLTDYLNQNKKPSSFQAVGLTHKQ